MPRTPIEPDQPGESPEDAQSVTRPVPPEFEPEPEAKPVRRRRAPRKAKPAPEPGTVTLTVPVCPLGHVVAASQKFCPECGQPCGEPEPPQEWVCGLGHVSPPAHKFCAECGTPRAETAPLGAYAAADPRPRPDAELTAEERADRDRRHQEAIRLGAIDPPVSYQPPSGGKTELIHFVEDGFSFAGQIWYRGQELELDAGTPRWHEAQRWLHMDEFAQMDRYGKVMFRKGPWRGKTYADASGWDKLKALSGDGEVPPPSVEELLHAQQSEARRRRGVPQPTIR